MTTFGALLAEQRGVAYVRHAVLTFSGTWAPPGWGYPSDAVRFANEDLLYEVPVQSPWSFGPVGGTIEAPSYRQSVDIAVDWACDWIEHHQGTFGVVGYSQGAEAASRVLIELQSGRLQDRMTDFIGGGCFGNPMRQAGKYVGADPKGHGIATQNLTATPANWAEVANKGDLYAATPGGAAGELIGKFYEFGVEAQLNNFGQFVKDMAHNIAALIPDLGGVLTGNITTDVAAAQAAIVALQFVATGTEPHISYELREIAPGVTGLGYMIGHLNRIAAATPARA